ncbi:hypothetical protein BT69DRAFT_1346123 [Atractiella rhizophila]|nr:hypothetical protein BT69DRAFT_1346123 [Atractiella rhizophila]
MPDSQVRGNRIPQEKRDLTVALLLNGKAPRHVAKETGISLRTVQRINKSITEEEAVERTVKNPDSPPTGRKLKRPRKVPVPVRAIHGRVTRNNPKPLTSNNNIDNNTIDPDNALPDEDIDLPDWSGYRTPPLQTPPHWNLTAQPPPAPKQTNIARWVLTTPPSKLCLLSPPRSTERTSRQVSNIGSSGSRANKVRTPGLHARDSARDIFRSPSQLTMRAPRSQPHTPLRTEPIQPPATGPVTRRKQDLTGVPLDRLLLTEHSRVRTRLASPFDLSKTKSIRVKREIAWEHVVLPSPFLTESPLVSIGDTPTLKPIESVTALVDTLGFGPHVLQYLQEKGVRSEDNFDTLISMDLQSQREFFFGTGSLPGLTDLEKQALLDRLKWEKQRRLQIRGRNNLDAILVD